MSQIKTLKIIIFLCCFIKRKKEIIQYLIIEDFLNLKLLKILSYLNIFVCLFIFIWCNKKHLQNFGTCYKMNKSSFDILKIPKNFVTFLIVCNFFWISLKTKLCFGEIISTFFFIYMYANVFKYVLGNSKPRAFIILI